ncbi:hypothetical protein [Gordonia sp. SL306]|uniref:hypothetical protein n=1 Tax=Gordonia sp. SL306 TaxID=2995145 RepID=UPI00226E4A66|nr:hypothetical protein [Gordonia sp. SL306]WAC57218.1 hypothetical protein OVA31_08260 [Gordonia sp. SL306]
MTREPDTDSTEPTSGDTRDVLHPGPADNDGNGGMATREVAPEVARKSEVDDAG